MSLPAVRRHTARRRRRGDRGRAHNAPARTPGKLQRGQARVVGGLRRERIAQLVGELDGGEGLGAAPSTTWTGAIAEGPIDTPSTGSRSASARSASRVFPAHAIT